MRTFASIVLVGSLVAFVGCTKSEPGGPGAPSTPGAPEDKSKEFKFDEGVFKSLSLKQGEKKNYDVTISRGKEFKQDVKIKIETPKGITVDKVDTEIKRSETKVTVSIGADKEAALGDHTVKITGTPETGKPMSYDLTVKVSKGD